MLGFNSKRKGLRDGVLSIKCWSRIFNLNGNLVLSGKHAKNEYVFRRILR